MHRNLKVGVLEIQGHHPISRAERQENGLCGLHMKVGDIHKAVEEREVDHRAPTTGDLASHKETTVIAGRRRSRFYSLLAQQV